MTFVVIFCLIVITLFVVAFIAKRRFGMLGLALAAGAMLSSLWVEDLTPLVARTGLVLTAPPLESVVAASLILLPAIFLLTSGPAYKSLLQRCIGAALFALLATTLLLEPMGSAFIINDTGKQVYDFLVTHHVTIVTLCLIIAIFDVILTKAPKIPSKH